MVIHREHFPVSITCIPIRHFYQMTLANSVAKEEIVYMCKFYFWPKCYQLGTRTSQYEERQGLNLLTFLDFATHYFIFFILFSLYISPVFKT